MESDRINKYYSGFMDRDIGELIIKIAPLKNEIPELRSFGRDPRDNSFNIEFVFEGEGLIKAFDDKVIEIYLGNNSGRIGIIKVKNTTNISDIIVEIHKSIGSFKAQSFKRIKEAATLKEKLDNIGRYDMLDRQIRESEDLLNQANNR
jgi:hypothetical protein